MSQLITGAFNPALHFLGFIKQAIEDGITRHCSIIDGTEVYLVPAEQAYYTKQDNIEALRFLCLVDKASINFNLLPNWRADNKDIQTGRTLSQRKNTALLIKKPLNELLWYATLCASEGRLLQGHDIDTPVRLRVMPDFTKLYHLETDITLAKLLYEQSLSLNILATKTAIHLTRIIDFYNACVLLDLITIESNNSFNPEDYLLGLIAKGEVDKQTRCLSLAGQTPLFLASDESKYYTEADASNLLKLCRTPLVNMDISIVNQNAEKESVVQIGRSRVRQKNVSVLPKVQGRPLAELQFQTALHASQGRLLSGCTLNMRVHLKQWPDKSLLKDAVLNKEERYFFTLALFMTDKTASLSDIANATRVPLDKVIDFHNACAIAGLIEHLV